VVGTTRIIPRGRRACKPNAAGPEGQGRFAGPARQVALGMAAAHAGGMHGGLKAGTAERLAPSG